MILENNISIDEFKPGSSLYILTHYHSDHYRGLNKTWNNGKIIASKLTCTLLESVMGIEPRYLYPIEENTPYKFAEYNLSLIAHDAGHCPGALLFNMNIGEKKVIYTGDFRLNDIIRKNVNSMRCPETLYLDTTYENIKIKFPSQEEAIKQAIEIIEDYEDSEILIAIYTIGKNRLIKAVSEHFKKPVYVSENIYKTWKIIGHDKYATTNKNETNIHAKQRAWFDKKNYLPSGSVAIIPTPMPGAYDYLRGNVFKVNYSEHCDIFEIEEFKRLIKPKRIVKI